MKVPEDVLGNIVILKFDRKTKSKDKKEYAKKFLLSHNSVRTVLEKTEGFKGRLRTHKTKHILGEKNKEALYKENGCLFRFNVDTCYFSARLASERKEIAGKIKKNEHVLIMFGGVGVFAIVASKLSKAKRIVSVELGRECNKYAKVNLKRNKVSNVELVQGDVRKKILGVKGKFDRIVMARPKLKDSFLDLAFKKIKSGGVIHYYGFYEEKKLDDLRTMVLHESRKARKKVKIRGIKKAGDVGAYRYRYRADLKAL